MFNEKILCIGSNSEDTDNQTTLLAKQNNTINHGLISDPNFVPTLPGYYHTSIVDISAGSIIQLAKHFDNTTLLDQPIDEWSHWKPLMSSYKLILELDQQGHSTTYKDNNNIQKYKNFNQLFSWNKSFCIYPFILLTEESGTTVPCARSSTKITTINRLDNYKTDPEYTKIRTAMIKGEKLPNHCGVCYDYESKGIESYREFETIEWISKLNINSVEDLNKITHPYYYEIRLSNKCNIMCRGCKPEHSHLIAKEYKKFNIVFPYEQSFKYSSTALIDINHLNPDTRVYLTGGDPTVIPEVYEFMEKCIAAGKTDFDFTLGINGQKISKKFLELTNHFTNLNFSVSLDGYGKVNDYWRWGSDFDTVIKNTHLLNHQGHTIGINCVPGIYNVTNLHLLYEFLDRELPYTSIYVQINNNPMQSVYNHPNTKLVIESLEKCKQTKMYYSDGKSNKTFIDSAIEYYSNNPQCDLNLLKQFFEYNDKLDHARNVRLADYIPELEECRKLIDFNSVIV